MENTLSPRGKAAGVTLQMCPQHGRWSIFCIPPLEVRKNKWEIRVSNDHETPTTLTLRGNRALHDKEAAGRVSLSLGSAWRNAFANVLSNGNVARS